MFDFGNKFWKTYLHEKKLLNLEFMDAHEHTRENIKTVDNALYKFLNDLYEYYGFDDTAVVLYSDHGHHDDLMFNLGFYESKVERVLPFLFIILPFKNENLS